MEEMKTILVAVDMTGASRGALGRAARLAQTTGASLRVLHAVPSSAFDKDAPEMRRFVREAVQEVIGELPAPRPDFSLRITAKDVEEAILEEAQKAGADLIVLGAHGEPRFRDAIFGTTATHVVRHTNCPVLVAQNDPATPYSKVMLALADAGETGALLGIVDDLAPGAALFGVSAFDPSLGRLFAGPTALDKAADAREARIGEALPGGTPVVENGDPLTVLMDEARTLDPDLIAMGTSQRAYLNSYAVDALFWCERDLLVVPMKEAKARERRSLGGALFT
jgi:nucleotide-binding universal stress UspA family protein